MVAPKGHAPYPGCETGGRPKKYNDEFIEKEAELLLEWIKKPSSPWIGQFAVQRGYGRQRMNEWREINQKFADAFEKAQDVQMGLLIHGGLSGKMNPGFTKFVMTNACGWREKTEISGDSENPLSCIIQYVEGNSKELVNES